MAATRRLTELLAGARRRLRLVPGPVTVALSGGADSAALAVLVQDAGVEADAVHVNHGFPASGTLERAARAIAGKVDIQLECIAVDVGSGPSPEEQARNARYREFDQHSRPVLTAHTRDDTAETLLINLIRGTGPSGLAGIPFHRPPTTFRPILDVTRDETREIAVLSDLPFFDDPMNEDLGLLRNRVRRQILPAMRAINPQILDSLHRAATSIGRDVELLEAHVATVDTSGGVPVGLLLALPRPLSERVMAGLLESSGIGLTSDRVDRMWSVARGETERQDLAGGLVVTRDRAELVIIKGALGDLEDDG